MDFLLLLGLGVVGFSRCVKSGCEKNLKKNTTTEIPFEEKKKEWISCTKQIYICHDVESDFIVGKFVPKHTKKVSGREVREECLEECRRRIVEAGLTPNEYTIEISCNVY